MPRVSSDDEEWDEEEWPDDDDTSETVPCPHCGTEVYEDSVRCPVCGEYVTHSTSALSGRPTWYIVLAIVGIVAVIATCLAFF